MSPDRVLIPHGQMVLVGSALPQHCRGFTIFALLRPRVRLAIAQWSQHLNTPMRIESSLPNLKYVVAISAPDALLLNYLSMLYH